MNFGKQTVFDYVRKMTADPESDDDYHILFGIVRHDCLSLLGGCKLSQEDKDDIIQNVQISVFSGLIRYVEQFANASEPQRNAYLRTILFRRRDDLLARNYKHGKTVSYDGDDFPLELCGTQDDMFDALSAHETLQQALHFICKAPFPPAQIIGYLMSRSTAPSGKNGRPALVAQRLNGLPLQEAAQIAIEQIQAECPCPIDARIYMPLLNKLEQPTGHEKQDNPCFSMTPQAISTTNSRIANYLRKHRDQFNGGNIL